MQHQQHFGVYIISDTVVTVYRCGGVISNNRLKNFRRNVQNHKLQLEYCKGGNGHATTSAYKCRCCMTSPLQYSGSLTNGISFFFPPENFKTILGDGRQSDTIDRECCGGLPVVSAAFASVESKESKIMRAPKFTFGLSNFDFSDNPY